MSSFEVRYILYLLFLGVFFITVGSITLLVYDPRTFESTFLLRVWWAVYVPITITIAIGVWWVILAVVDIIRLVRNRR